LLFSLNSIKHIKWKLMFHYIGSFALTQISQFNQLLSSFKNIKITFCDWFELLKFSCDICSRSVFPISGCWLRCCWAWCWRKFIWTSCSSCLRPASISSFCWKWKNKYVEFPTTLFLCEEGLTSNTVISKNGNLQSRKWLSRI